MTNTELEKRLESLALEDLAGQVLCYPVYDKDNPADVEEVFRAIRPGGIFIAHMSAQKVKMYAEMANKYAKAPVIVAADIEFGVGCALAEYPKLPQPMAWGAAGDEKLVRRAGELTGAISRKHGIHWSFAPVVDINYNKNSPITNIRAVSDSPELVWRMASAYSVGMQKNGYMAAGTKHFPGDGVDDRNQHFCTTVNTFSQDEWWNTYGMVYRKMIESGTSSIMAAHIALPAFQEGESEDPLPCVLSAKLMTELLRERLKFDGCIVSDAMSMVGACSRIETQKLAVSFLRAGGDMVLFPEKTDYENILAAVKTGELSRERLLSAVRRVLRLKNSVRLFEDQSIIQEELKDISESEYCEVAQQIADKSIKVIRNDHVFPLDKSKVKTALLLHIGEHKKESDKTVFLPLERGLQARGIRVKAIWQPSHYDIEKSIEDYDLVLINAKFVATDLACGASMRIGWDNIMLFWRGYIFKNKNLVFTSFSDPYKLYELPFLKTYINCFSPSEFSQRALIKLLFGEIEATAKNPINFPPFFNFGE
ncbi:MAG: hypothetical protein LBH24_06315 [Clostridiales bacterium]|jgi:beta-N-acetylhexosaminidase|nr:hypothetical protein [Clostridiales bacterium]